MPLHPGTGTCVPRFLPFCGSRHGESARDFLSPNCVNLFPGATAQPGTRAMPSRCWPRGVCQSKCATPSTVRRRFSSRAAAAMAMQRRDGRCARLGQILTRWTPDVGTDAKQKQLRNQYSTGLNIMDDFQFSLILQQQQIVFGWLEAPREKTHTRHAPARFSVLRCKNMPVPY